MKNQIFVLLLVMLFVSCNEKQSKKSKEEIAIEKSLDDSNETKKYKIITPEIIDKLSDDELETAIYNSIIETFKNDYDHEFENIKKLSAGQQMFWSTWILEGEVNNGGFNQFYFNSSGEFGQMALDGYKIIQAKDYAALVSKANKIYAENKERLATYDDGSMESFSDSYKDNPLNKLDDEFYDLGKKENTSKLRVKYIREHKSEFITK